MEYLDEVMKNLKLTIITFHFFSFLFPDQTNRFNLKIYLILTFSLLKYSLIS